MKKIKKKGDLPSGFVVIIVLLLIGFVILLFFLFRFLWQERIDKETCHTSIILRGTASSVSGLAEDYVPLKCKTAKYCITNRLIGKGDCPGFKGEEKEVTKIRVGSGDKGKEDIERFMAREIVDCWSMTGEGKISLFTQYLAKEYGVAGVYPTCVLCSRIAFDKKSLEDGGIDLSQINVRSYMISRKVPDKDVSYFEYLLGEGGKMSITDKREIADIIINDKGEIIRTGELKLDDLKDASSEKQEKEIYEKEMTILFMQISAPDHLESISNILKTAAGGTVGSFVLAPVITAKLIKTAVVGWKITLPLAIIFGIYQYGSVAYNRAVTAGYCGDVSVGGEARSGCSVVRTMTYNATEITKYCQAIESIP